MKRSDMVYKLIIDHADLCPDMRELTYNEASKLLGTLEHMGMEFIDTNYEHGFESE